MKIFVTAILTIVIFQGKAQNLFLNEIIAENVNGQMDDFFQREDWLEIYNTGGITNLAGYYLSDDPDSLTKWQIPATNAGVTTVLPNNHIIFWLDKDPEQGEDHVDFSINSDGETLTLTAPDGVTIIDQIDIPSMAGDISYGRSCDGCDSWQYFNNVTYDNDNIETANPTSLVFINEVQTNNVSTWKDLSNEYDSWFEIYNPNGFQVNMAGYTIELSNGLTWTFPTNDPVRTAIRSGQFKLFWADGEPEEGSHHTTFVLHNTPVTLTLKGPDNSVVDTYEVPAMPSDQSYGRQTDGSVTSILFEHPTPEVTNGLVIVIPPVLFINEILTVNVNDTMDNILQHEDWFEIYNPNAFTVNLSGYYFSDNPENPRKWKVPSYVPDSVTVPANGWLLFWADEDADQGAVHASFKLNNSAESLRFTSPDGITIIDEIAWEGMDRDTSYGRITDGSSEWWSFIESTPALSNNQGILSVHEAYEKDSEVSVFPNPFGTILHFNQELNVRVYALDGRFIAQYTEVKTLNTSDWISGYYLLSFENGQFVRVIKN
ncbi:MAG: lamin tail domain-containing protein [Flavobacteriales bacterium]